MSSSTIGKHILSLANTVVQKGAKDTIADDRLRDASTYLSSEEMPFLNGSEESGYMLENSLFILSSEFICILEESLAAVVEAHESWSDHRRIEQTKRIEVVLPLLHARLWPP